MAKLWTDVLKAVAIAWQDNPEESVTGAALRRPTCISAKAAYDWAHTENAGHLWSKTTASHERLKTKLQETDSLPGWTSFNDRPDHMPVFSFKIQWGLPSCPQWYLHNTAMQLSYWDHSG